MLFLLFANFLKPCKFVQAVQFMLISRSANHTIFTVFLDGLYSVQTNLMEKQTATANFCRIFMEKQNILSRNYAKWWIQSGPVVSFSFLFFFLQNIHHHRCASNLFRLTLFRVDSFALLTACTLMNAAKSHAYRHFFSRFTLMRQSEVKQKQKQKQKSLFTHFQFILLSSNVKREGKKCFLRAIQADYRALKRKPSNLRYF